MASWTDIRRAARRYASALRSEYGGSSAQSMLAGAQAATGIQCVALAADDPLLEGSVAAPPGALLNAPDQLSAADPTYVVSAHA